MTRLEYRLPVVLSVALAGSALMAQTPPAQAPQAQPPTAGQQGQPPATGAPGQKPTFRVTVDLVTNDLIARDSRGQFVADVTKDDFEIFEDGVPQQIASLVLVHGGRVSNLALPPPAAPPEGIILPPARPSNDASRRVFLRIWAPRNGLTGPAAVGHIVRRALAQAGVRTSGRGAAHLFRHGLATKMIRHGASMSEIAEVLRHRSQTTSATYAHSGSGV